MLVQIDVHRSTGDNDPEVLALSNDLLKKPEENVPIHLALVNLIDHNHTVVIELHIRNNSRRDHWIVRHLTKQLFICHVLDLCHLPVPIEVVIKMNTIANRFSQNASLLLCNTPR